MMAQGGLRQELTAQPGAPPHQSAWTRVAANKANGVVEIFMAAIFRTASFER